MYKEDEQLYSCKYLLYVALCYGILQHYYIIAIYPFVKLESKETSQIFRTKIIKIKRVKR